MTTAPLLAGIALALAVLSNPSPTLPSDGPSGTRHDAGRAQLDVEEDGASIHVRALFLNGDDAGDALTYTLDVSKEGRSTSTSRQSGDFTALAGETVTFSTSRVGVSAGDEVTVVLTVSDRTGVLDSVDFHTTATL